MWDYQAKTLSFVILSRAFPSKLTSETTTGSIPGFSLTPKQVSTVEAHWTQAPCSQTSIPLWLSSFQWGQHSPRPSSEKPEFGLLDFQSCELHGVIQQHHVLSHQPPDRHHGGEADTHGSTRNLSSLTSPGPHILRGLPLSKNCHNWELRWQHYNNTQETRYIA